MFGHYPTSYRTSYQDAFEPFHKLSTRAKETKPNLQPKVTALVPITANLPVKPSSVSTNTPLPKQQTLAPIAVPMPLPIAQPAPARLSPLNFIHQILNKIPRTNPYTIADIQLAQKHSFSHHTFVKKIRAHFQKKNQPVCQDPGFCGGLAMLWLYSSAIGNASWFHIMKKILMADNCPEHFQKDRDNFFEIVNFLQNPSAIFPFLSQGAMDALFNIEMQSVFLKADDCLQEKLTNLKADDLIYIRSYRNQGTHSVNHTVTITYDGHKYTIFDSNYFDGQEKQVSCLQDLIHEIKKSLRKNSFETLPLLINIGSGVHLRAQPVSEVASFSLSRPR